MPIEALPDSEGVSAMDTIMDTRKNVERRSRRSSRGFTVIELLVAVAVLSISLLGLAQLLGVAIQQNQLSRYNTAALEVARGKLERLKAQFNRQLETGVPSSDLVDGSHGPESVVLSSQDEAYGSRMLQVSWRVSSPGGSRKDVQINVNPLGAGNQNQGLWHKVVTIDTSFTP